MQVVLFKLSHEVHYITSFFISEETELVLFPKFAELISSKEVKHCRRQNPPEEEGSVVEVGVGLWSWGPLGWILTCL